MRGRLSCPMQPCYNWDMTTSPVGSDSFDCPNPPSQEEQEQAQALFAAIANREWKEVARLALGGTNLDDHKHGPYDDTPLILAARLNAPIAALQALLERSDPLQSNSNGRTALIFAASGGKPHSPDMVRLLLPSSNPLALDIGKSSALSHAVRAHAYRDASQVIELLLPVSDLAQENSNHQTPLELARMEDCDDVVALILSEMARRESLELGRSVGNALQKKSSVPRL